MLPFITRKTIDISSQDYSQASLFGKGYSYGDKKEFHEKFTSIIWMSYRNGRNDNDVGWGCMIKVVQMLLAEVFMRYYTKANSCDVIRLFSDEC